MELEYYVGLDKAIKHRRKLPGQGLNLGLPNDTLALYPLFHKLIHAPYWLNVYVGQFCCKLQKQQKIGYFYPQKKVIYYWQKWLPTFCAIFPQTYGHFAFHGTSTSEILI
jgi:hypothetical protein